MGFRSSFRVQVGARVVLAGLLLYALVWSLLHTSWDAAPLLCGLLLVLAVVELVRYVESATRDLATMLRAVAAGDFTTVVPQRLRTPPFSEYGQASRALLQVYRRLDLRRAASDELLRAVIDHVGVAVLCFSAGGRLAFANSEARRLFAAPGLQDLHDLNAVDASLRGRLLALRDEERAQLDLPLPGGSATLLLHARRFVLLGETFTVVVGHDIRAELESRDVQAWQRLARVLTHEMMNSLTPIVTLSGHLRSTLGAQGGTDGDVAESLDVIHERGSGLARFIEAYRRYANPPPPAPAPFAVADLLEQVARLLRPGLDAEGIALGVVIESPGLTALADASQIEQVLINLVRNAQQALRGAAAPRIQLRAASDQRGRACIRVQDNGPGIAAELADKVFMPFFTTRSEGGGIGLALSRQLLQLNGGTLALRSSPGSCCFLVTVPTVPRGDSHC